MTERGQAVWDLLRAYLAWIPGPHTGRATRSAQRGEAPTRRVPCMTCKGNRRVRVRGVMRPCDDCVESNARSPRFGQPTGRITVDSYTGKRKLAEQETKAWTTGSERTAWELNTELALERIEGQLRLHDGSEAQHDSYTAAYENAERLTSQGGYPDLRQALAWLADTEPAAHSLVWSAMIYAPFHPPVGTVRSACESICELMQTRMGDPIIVPGWAHAAADWRDSRESFWRGRTPAHVDRRADRDSLIREQRANGTPVASLMATFSLSQAQVYRALAASVATVAA